MKHLRKAQEIQQRQAKDLPTTEAERDWARGKIDDIEATQTEIGNAKKEGGTRRRHRTRSTRRRHR
jgi:hypothetical protein